MSRSVLEKLGIQDVNPGACWGPDGWIQGTGDPVPSINPATGETLASVVPADEAAYEAVASKAHESFLTWRMLPAPKRGEVVRQLGDALREFKEPLGDLVTLEMGKIRAEGHGEVQEMIDICDFAVGLSRQLYGLTMHSERPGHRMYEQWHPLGAVGVISAFNFPVAVWAWNAALAAVCGDTDRLEALVLDARSAPSRCSTSRTGSWPTTVSRGSSRTSPDPDARWGSASSTTRASRSSRSPGPRAWDAACRESGRQALRLDDPGARRQQRDHRDAERRPRNGDSGDPLRRGRHGRAALHEHASDHRASLRLREAHGDASSRPTGRCASAIRSRRTRSWGRWSTTRRCRRTCGPRSSSAKAEGGEVVCGGNAPAGEGPPLRRADDRQDAGPDGDRRGGDLRADPLPARVRDARRGDRAPQRRAAGPLLCDLHAEHARGRDVPLARRLRLRDRQRQHRHLRAPRSAGRSAGRRRRAAAASRARTRGRPTCAARRTPSTGRTDLPLAQGISFEV